jgi:hypothetical protein
MRIPFASVRVRTGKRTAGAAAVSVTSSSL